MAQPSITTGTNKPELNPAALFQATPNSTSPDGSGFEAALDRARQSDKPRESGPEQRSATTREPERDAARTTGERPADASANRSRERPASSERTTTESDAPKQEAATEDGGEELATTEAPAGLPAEIAAIIAALAGPRLKGAAATTDAEPLPDMPGSKLALGIADLLGGRAMKTGADAGASAADGPDLPIALDAKDKNPSQQAQLLLVSQQARTQNPSEALLSAAARVDANTNAQGAGIAFAARLETAQQASQVPQLPVATTVGHRGWANEVGSQVAWMIGKNESKAELVLTPPSLGKLGVSIQVNGDQTTAHFVAASQATRDALEQAMPRLREVLQQAGINLGETNVSTSSDQRAHDGQGGSGQRSGRGSGGGDDASTVSAVGQGATTWVRSGAGAIDTFA